MPRELLAGKFDQGDMQMLITVSSNDGAQKAVPLARSPPTSCARLHNSPYVAQVISPWTAPPSVAAVAGQQGRQHRADRRGHQRRSERRTAACRDC